MNWIKPVRRLLLPLIAFTLIAGLGLLGLLLWRRNAEVTLPVPRGPYPVGRLEYDWADPGRIDPLGKGPGRPRKLNVWIWYPGERLPSQAEPASYTMAQRGAAFCIQPPAQGQRKTIRS